MLIANTYLSSVFSPQLKRSGCTMLVECESRSVCALRSQSHVLDRRQKCPHNVRRARPLKSVSCFSER